MIEAMVMDVKDIAPQEFAGWCAWRDWVSGECDKYAPLSIDVRVIGDKLYREERWSWWQRALMIIFGQTPKHSSVCTCISTWLKDSSRTRPYYTDEVCAVHAQQFGIKRQYSEDIVSQLVKMRYGG